ncbi:Lrp/AsnC family transcriptional regulator [Marinihelvus fidelis]|nr:Lrp/AsnC family transcriptional regulator [Marinihelvus fidelis]
MNSSLDAIDIRILDIFQREGRISSQALAERVGLSTSPCWRRVRKLEKAGVLGRDVTLLNAAALGLDVIAIANVSLEDHHPDSVADFDRMVKARDEIQECFATSGEYDYMLKVICADIAAYDRLLSGHIMRCKAVHQVNTSFVLRSTKQTTALPLPG